MCEKTVKSDENGREKCTGNAQETRPVKTVRAGDAARARENRQTGRRQIVADQTICCMIDSSFFA